MATKWRRRLRARSYVLAAFVLVIAVAWKSVSPLRTVLDLGLDDEAIYLEAGLDPSLRHTLAESSPLYSLWYGLLGLLVGLRDPVRVYDLNLEVLVIALTITLFVLARRSGAPLWATLCMSLVWGCSSAIVSWPRIPMLAALILGVGGIAITFLKRDDHHAKLRWAVTNATLAVASFVRPDLWLGVLVLTPIVVVMSLRKREGRSITSACLALGTPALMWLGFGRSPWVHNRSFFAFRQHYALNVIESKNERGVVDVWFEFDEITRLVFPKSESVLGALKENPSELFWHVGQNIKKLPLPFVDLVGPMQHLRLPIQAALSIALIATIVCAIRTRKLPSWSPLMAVVLACTVIAMLIIYPRDHVGLPATFLGLAWLASSCAARARRPSWLRSPRSQLVQVALAGVFLLVIPPRRKGEGFGLLTPGGRPAPAESELETRRTIDVLRRLPFRRDANLAILEPDYSYGIFLRNVVDHHPRHVAEWAKRVLGAQTFTELLDRDRVNVVVMTPRLAKSPTFRSDPDLTAFLKKENAASQSFVFKKVEGTTVTLAIHKDVLARDVKEDDASLLDDR